MTSSSKSAHKSKGLITFGGTRDSKNSKAAKESDIIERESNKDLD